MASGQAVSVSYESLANCHTVVLAMKEDAVIGIATIKGKRPKYTAKIGGRADFEIPSHYRELGYVAVQPYVAGQAVSRALLVKLLTDYDGALFITTSNDKIKAVMTRAGFKKYGQDWYSERGRCLSLLMRQAKVMTVRARLWKALQTIARPKGWLPV